VKLIRQKLEGLLYGKIAWFNFNRFTDPPV